MLGLLDLDVVCSVAFRALIAGLEERLKRRVFGYTLPVNVKLELSVAASDAT